MGKNASAVPVIIGVVSLAGTLDTTLDGEVTFTLHAVKVTEREIFMGKEYFYSLIPIGHPPPIFFFMLLAHFSVCNSEKLDSPGDKTIKLLNIIVTTAHVSGTLAMYNRVPVSTVRMRR